jgi:hypothetical protein
MKAKPKTQSKQGNDAEPPRPIPCTLDQKLQDLAQRVRITVIQHRIWNDMFTEEERQVIAANDTMGPDIIDIWSKFREVSVQHAVVDLAREMSFLSAPDASRLLAELGETATPIDVKPIWDKSTGKIRLGGCTIKRVHKPNLATNISRILDAFQEEGWPPQIIDPLPEIKELKQTPKQRLHEAVKSLNHKLTLVRFHTDGTGEGVFWERH